MNIFTQNLLAAINEMGEGLIEFIITPPGKLRINKIPKTTYYSALSRLQKQGLVQRTKKGRQSTFMLTEKGKKLVGKPIAKKNRNDGLSTIIIFDIPEEKSRERTLFRRFLQKNGYINLQKSVLIAPFILSEDIKEMIGELGIRKNISVIEGKIKYNF